MASLKGAYSAWFDDASTSAVRVASEQLKGAYEAPIEVRPQVVQTKPAGAMEASLPPETTGIAAPQGFLAQYGKWIAIAAVVLIALGALGRRKRK